MFAEHYPGLARRLAMIVRDEAEGRDLAQEAYARAFQQRMRWRRRSPRSRSLTGHSATKGEWHLPNGRWGCWRHRRQYRGETQASPWTGCVTSPAKTGSYASGRWCA